MQGNNYVIVGGSSGIGLELVKNISAAGGNVTVFSRTSDSLAGLSGVTHVATDILADEMDTSSLPDHIHGFAYCPGSIVLKPFRSLKSDQFQTDFNINVLGAVKALKACFKGLKKSGIGSALLFSTVAVQQGMPFHSSIAAAKGAVEGLTRSLAAEWAPTIRVNCIAPSLTDTPLAGRLLATPEKKTASGDRHPLKRVGEAHEIAALGAFLLSEKAGWITGQVIGQDGGMSSVRV
ncbi:MAG: SDR family oxidoreductase [Bacteroidota bacterium]